MPLQAFTYAGDELVSEYGAFLTDFLGEYGDGYYLDNSLHADEEDLSLLSDDEEEWLLLTIAMPKTDLARDSWEISIHYNSSYIATCSLISGPNTNKVNGIFLPVLLCTVTGFVYCCHIIRMLKWKRIFIAAVTCLYALYMIPHAAAEGECTSWPCRSFTLRSHSLSIDSPSG